MASPSLNVALRDPGLATGKPASSIACVLGPASLGTANVLVSYNSPNAAADGSGQGQGPEAVTRILARAGGPVRFMKMATSVAAANSVVTKVAVSTSTGTVTVAGTALDDYEVIVEITKTGALGAAEFKFSLDDGRTYSEIIQVPAGGTYAIANTGLTLTFVPGGGPILFEDGDTHSFDSTAAMWNASDLATAIAALKLDTTTTWDFLVLAGRHATGAGAATIFAALDTHLTDLANNHRYTRALMDGGAEAAATVKTAFAAVSSRRIAVCFSTYDVPTAKPFQGWGAPMRPTVNYFASLAAANLISTDLAFSPAGAPEGDILAIGHDEFTASTTMDDAKFATMRTWPQEQGYFANNCRLKSPSGSDFKYWQHGRVMDVACATWYSAARRWSSAGLRCTSAKVLYEPEAIRVESDITKDLVTVLSTPKNATGAIGHVSKTDTDEGVAYRASRTEQTLVTETVAGDLAVRPLGYAKFINVTVGFSASVAAAA